MIGGYIFSPVRGLIQDMAQFFAKKNEINIPS